MRRRRHRGQRVRDDERRAWPARAGRPTRPRTRGGRPGRLSVVGVVVWWLVVAAVLPGVAAGATAPLPGDDPVSSDVERARGTTVNATAVPGGVAAGVGDNIVVVGATTFDAGKVRLYLVGPRGRFLDGDGTVGVAESEDVAAGTFDVTYESFTRRGTYRLLVVSPRADGQFESTLTLGRDALPADVTQRQAVDLVRAAYGRDEVVELSLHGETPRLGIDPVSADGTLLADEVVTVTGTTNRGDGTVVSVDLVDRDGRVVTGVETTADAASGTWEADLNLAGVEPGSYTLEADDTVSRASTTVVVVTEEATPTETPPADAVGTETTPDAAAEARATIDNATGASLENASAGLDAANGTVNRNASANGTDGTVNATAEGDGSTSGLVPGFGVGAAVAALAVVVLAVRRRTRVSR